jgi:hypothetical protein
MAINYTIRGVDAETRLRFRLLAVARGVSLATFFRELVDHAWDSDKTVLDKRTKHKVKRIVEAWKP